jgi:hypothetical protein
MEIPSEEKHVSEEESGIHHEPQMRSAINLDDIKPAFDESINTLQQGERKSLPDFKSVSVIMSNSARLSRKSPLGHLKNR